MPFEIPASWEWVRLENLYNAISAKRVLQADWKQEGVPFYRAREIVKLSQYGFVKNDLFITEEHYQSLKAAYGIPLPNDIMLSAVGTIGKTYIVKESDKFYYKDASVLCLQNLYDLYSEYIQIALNSPIVQGQMHGQSKGTTVDTITIEKVGNYILPFPPLAEQKRIVAEIEKWFALIDEIEANKQDLQEYIKQAKSKVLDLAIHGKLVPQDPNDEPAIDLLKRIYPSFKPCDTSHYENLPSGWCISSLKDAGIEILNGYAFQSKNYVPNGIKVIRITNVQDGYIVDDDPKYYPISSKGEIGRYLLHENDLLMSLTGNVGRVGFLQKELLPAALNQRVGCIRGTEQVISKKYLYYFLQSDLFKADCIDSAKGVAQLNISTEWLKAYEMPIPPIEEQIRISTKIEQIFTAIDTITAEL